MTILCAFSFGYNCYPSDNGDDKENIELTTEMNSVSTSHERSLSYVEAYHYSNIVEVLLVNVGAAEVFVYDSSGSLVAYEYAPNTTVGYLSLLTITYHPGIYRISIHSTYCYSYGAFII